MKTSQSVDSTSTLGSSRMERLKPLLQVFTDNRIGYSVTLILGLAAALAVVILVEVIVITAALSVALVIAATAIHIVLTERNRSAVVDLVKLQGRVASEMSASRILSGIRQLNGSSSISDDARLASAARMATDYPASVIFNLRDAHGVLAPSSWNYEGQLSQIRDEFEAVDSDEPGAATARQGSAIVMSSTDSSYSALPRWAEHAGFTQGIVTPITRGLDTIGVVYALNKSSTLPTLNEIEQLELIVSFSSSRSNAAGADLPGTQNRPFRVIEKSPSAANQIEMSMPPIRMAGFALDPEFERMEMDEMTISLSPTEFLLIHTLASSPDKPISPVELMDRCWARDSRPADNAVDVAIFRLRKKLNKTVSGKGLIKTVRGNGYMFVPPAVDAGSPVIAD
jgi:DNA-binding winged helix-turn-helix (wHTH) protein